jgi:hypothetical protein
MPTGSIQDPSLTVSKYYEPHSLDLTLRNGSGGDLVHGQEVFLSANNSVNKRATGAQYPIGVVKVGGKNGDNVTIATSFQRDMLALASGAIAVGDPVRPTGVLDAAGRPTYVVATAGQWAQAVCLRAAADGAEARLGFLRVPFKV